MGRAVFGWPGTRAVGPWAGNVRCVIRRCQTILGYLMMRFLGRRLSSPTVPTQSQEAARHVDHNAVLFDVTEHTDGSVVTKLADVEQTICGVRQLRADDIDEMIERRHDIDHQLGLCRRMMQAGDILPYPFERAVIMLRKAKRFDEELELCRYVYKWCRKAEQSWDGRSAMHWKSPRYERCIARVPKIEKLKANSRKYEASDNT